MLTEGAWRKLPKDLLVDEDFAYIESLLPKEYAFAPYMFYVAALRKADDDGIFDVEDFVIFARLMRVDNPEIVRTIVNAMISRKILFHESRDTTLCGFVRWEHGEGSNKPRPLAARREKVKQIIEEQKKNQKGAEQFATAPAAEQSAQTGQSETENRNDEPPRQAPKGDVTANRAGDFSCPENDKKRENVVNPIFDDKNAKNVVEKIETERKKEKKEEIIPEEKEKTHTLEQREERETEKEAYTGSGHLECPPPVCAERLEAVAKTELTENPESLETKTGDSTPQLQSNDLAELALQAAQAGYEQRETPVREKLTEFFVKYCYGYDKRQGEHSISKLAKKLCEVGDEINPPDTICDLVCTEFKKLCETDRYWKTLPLLPSNMLKPRMWSQLMQYAGRILAGKQSHNAFLKAAADAQAEAEKESAQVYDELVAEFIKYNIDPNDPNRSAKLLQAKAATVVPEAEGAGGNFDIFLA